MSKTGIGIGISAAFIDEVVAAAGDCGDAEFPLIDDNVAWLIDDNGDCIVNDVLGKLLLDSRSNPLFGADNQLLLETWLYLLDDEGELLGDDDGDVLSD